MNLSPTEVARYQRHLSLAGFGAQAQERLRQGRVLVIGAGGLGCPALLYLAAAGVGRITVIDPDRVELSNLQRQILFATAEVGEPKADAAARRLRALNPLIAIEAIVGRFSRANALELVRACDVVLDGSDNFATRYLANDACMLADRPLVYGAIHGFEGQASVFNWRGGPTYRCLFSEPPEAGTVPNCAEAGVLGVLPGLIGVVQATETIKLLAGIGEPLSGRLLLWNALTHESRTVRFSADPRSRLIRDLPPDDYGAICAPPTPAVATPLEIDPPELRAALSGPRPPQLLDVREGWERLLGLIEPSVHLPLGQLSREPPAGLDPAMPTVVYCAAGARSLQGAQFLRERHGFAAVSSLRGGIKAWNRR
jgi:adenylyltransferase/sulfurtransferase